MQSDWTLNLVLEADPSILFSLMEFELKKTQAGIQALNIIVDDTADPVLYFLSLLICLGLTQSIFEVMHNLQFALNVK